MFSVRNMNEIIIVHININSIKNKIDLLAEELGQASIFLWPQRLGLMTLFLRCQFIISGFTTTFIFGRTSSGFCSALGQL